jgi:chromosome segregation ATPase
MSTSAPRHKDLQTRISTLTTELELNTFLNKGILQTNSEHKIRIAELEQENAILRAAESRLAKTEDMLEDVQKKCKALEVDIRRERLERERVETERNEWKGKFAKGRKVWEAVKSGMDEAWHLEENAAVSYLGFGHLTC